MGKKSRWHRECKTNRTTDEKESEGKKNLTQTARLSSFAPSVSHSFSPSIFLLHHPSLIVFTPRYLCFGPGGADIVSIPTSQTERERETLSFLILSIPQHLLRLPFWTVSHYNFLVLLEEVCYLVSSLPLHLCVYLLWELTISPSHLFFSLLDYPSFLLWWLLFPSLPPLFVYCDASFILPSLIPSFSFCLTLLFQSWSVLFYPLYFFWQLLPVFIPWSNLHPAWFPPPLLSYTFLLYLSFSFFIFSSPPPSIKRFFFHRLEMTQSSPKHTHTHTNSSYDMQM